MLLPLAWVAVRVAVLADLIPPLLFSLAPVSCRLSAAPALSSVPLLVMVWSAALTFSPPADCTVPALVKSPSRVMLPSAPAAVEVVSAAPALLTRLAAVMVLPFLACSVPLLVMLPPLIARVLLLSTVLSAPLLCRLKVWPAWPSAMAPRLWIRPALVSSALAAALDRVRAWSARILPLPVFSIAPPPVTRDSCSPVVWIWPLLVMAAPLVAVPVSVVVPEPTILPLLCREFPVRVSA